METNEIAERLEDWDIVMAIENKDVPFVLEQVKGLIIELNYRTRYETAKEIFEKIESQDLLSLRKVNGVGYIIQQYEALKKEFGVV